MNALQTVFVAVLVSLVLTACGGVPVKQQVEETLASKVAVQANEDACPPLIDPDAVMKHRYRKEWDRKVHERPTIYTLIACPQMRTLMAWGLSASRYENEPSKCTATLTSITCRSSRGPSGTSRRGGEKWKHSGSSYLELIAANNSLSFCPDAASEHRKVRFSINRKGKWESSAQHKCYW